MLESSVVIKDKLVCLIGIVFLLVYQLTSVPISLFRTFFKLFFKYYNINKNFIKQ